MPTQRITERFAFSGGKVRRDGAYPVIEGVKLCGAVSANRRRYKPEAFAGDRVKRYAGKPVYLDHGAGRAGRGYRDKIGWIENPRIGPDGMPVGDIGLNPKHAETESVLWVAEHKSDYAGMSHVANCQTARAADGWEDVTEMADAESVDIVVEPATTKGFFEHKGTAVKISLKQYAERRGPSLGPDTWGAIVKLCREMGDDFADAPVMDEPPADAPAEGDLKTALMSALAPMLDEAFDSGDVSKLVSALKDFVKLHAKHTGGAAPKDEPEEEPEKDKEESRPTMAGVLAECKAAGLESPSIEFVAALMETPSAAARLPFIKLAREAKAPPRETPKAGGRAPGAGETGTRTTEKSVPTDGKAFAESVR
jgi:hypothetical protein